MKFSKYINEDFIDSMIEDTIKTIGKDCQPFIKDWQKLNTTKWLMSGRRKRTPIIEKKTTRKNRIPRDTPEGIHKLMDKFFYKKFGVHSRSNSIFCSFNPNMADNYGNLHLIFPIGKYKAVSSIYVDDIWDYITMIGAQTTGKDYFTKSLYSRLEDWEIDEIHSSLLKYLKDSGYTDKLIFHNNEIMVTCKEYYIVNRDFNKSLLEHFRS